VALLGCTGIDSLPDMSVSPVDADQLEKEMSELNADLIAKDITQH
jgi:hypothetical protein